jgi:hypothetical protein
MKGTHMKQLKYLLPLLLTIITLAIYNPIQTEASTSNYTFTVNTGDLKISTGTFGTNSTWRYSSLIAIENNSVIFSNFDYITWIALYNGSTYLGFYALPVISSTQTAFNNSGKYLGTLSQFTIGSATHFRIGADLTGTNWGQTPSTSISASNFQTKIVSYTTPPPPIPYTIEQKNPYYSWIQNEFDIRDYYTVFITGNDYSLLSQVGYQFNDSYYDDNGNLITNNVSNDPNSVSYLNLTGELLYLNMPLPANITQAGTYDLWLTLLDYNGDFKSTYRPTSNNILIESLRQLGAFSFVLNYTDNYKSLPDAQNFKIEYWRSENQRLQTFYNTNSTTLLQLAAGPTNFYQPNDNTLFVDTNDPNNNFDVRDYFTAANIGLPVKEGYTLLGFIDRSLRPFTGQSITPTFVFSRTNQDTVYYPVFEQNITYDVTFTDYDDTVIETVTVQAGQTAIPTQTPTRTGYVFAYWEPPVTDIQGNLTTKAIYYVPITWRNTSFATIRIDQVIEGEMPSPPTLEGYTRTWSPTIVVATEPTQYIVVAEVVTTSGNEQTSGVTPIPSDYSPISDLFGGVIGASIGAVMTLGTIDLYGIQLSSIIYLFISMSLGLWILKAIRG